MASIYEQKDRVVFPRWRDFDNTINSGDIRPFAVPPKRIYSDADIELKILAWKEDQSIANALELLNSAYNLGLYDYAEQTAQYLRQEKKVIPLGLQRIIDTVLKLDNDATPIFTDVTFDKNLINNYFHREIAKHRARLRHFESNAISWVELGRLHAIVNNLSKAETALLIALRLAPENRYVLRSLARFYVHTSQSEKALFYLRRSEASKHDPWLLSTQLSITNQIKRHPGPLAKRGFALVESKRFAPFDVNELASSLGTMELFNGASKAAKRLFKQSLINPNDNSVAQATWASNIIPSLEIEQRSLKLPSAYEARAFEFYREGKYQDAFNESVRWLLDEPYATRPARFSTFLASTHLENYKIAAEISMFSLQIAPDNFDLINNLAYSTCLLGNAIGAAQVYSRVNENMLSPKEEVVYAATSGLIQYRNGNPSHGKKLYEQAINSAKDLKDEMLYRLAMVNFMREEYLQNPTRLEDAMPILEKAKENLQDEDLHKEFERIEQILIA